MNNTLKGYLFAALSSASYGVNPLAVYLYNDGLNVDAVLFYRYFFATLMLAALMCIRKIDFRLSATEALMLLGMGLLFAFSSEGLFISYKYIGVSIASTVLFTYPALVALLVYVFFRELPSKLTLITIPIIFVGVVLLDLNGIVAGQSKSIFGISIVLLSAISYAIYMICVQKSRLSRMSSVKLGFYSLLFGSFLFIGRLVADNGIPMLSGTTQWSVSLALAFFPSLVSILTMAVAIRNIGSTDTAVMGALEPVVAVLIGVILFGERPEVISWCGMGIIIVSVTLLVIMQKAKTK